MATKTNVQRLTESINKRKGDEGKSSSSSSVSNADRLRKTLLERTINFDTFETDLKNVGSTINNIYSGWQTADTMNSTKSSVEAMQRRINAYQEYQSKFGSGSSADISEIAGGYQSVLDDWDDRTTLYGGFKNADSYNVSMKKTKYDLDFEGLNYDQVQAKKKEYAKGSDEYEYLDKYMNYTDLTDFDKALENTADSDYYKELKKARNKYKLDHAFDIYKHYMDNEDFDEKSQYVSTESDEWHKGLTTAYGLGYKDITYEYINDVDGMRSKIEDKARAFGSDTGDTVSSMEKKGYDRLSDEEKSVYNYIYSTKGKKKAQEYLDDLEVTLGKGNYDEQTGKLEKTIDGNAISSALLSVASVPANILGGFTGAIDSVSDLMQGKQYNPYSYYKLPSNFSSDVRKYVGDNIEEATEGTKLLGQNIPRFLYDTGMSVADSAVGALTLGRAYTPLMGVSAYQQKAKELTEAGEDVEITQSLSLANGVAEALFEYLSIDKLLKIKGVDGLKKMLTETAKQAGIEASEEIFTEASNILMDKLIRGNDSDLGQMKQDLIDRGYSEKEAENEVKKQFARQVGWAGAGGFLSGATMGGVSSVSDYAQNKKTGKQIRDNDRITDMWEMAAKSPQESDAFNAYSEYFNKGINEGNISDAQLGNLYNTAYREARGLLYSKKSSKTDKYNSAITLEKLGEVDKRNTISKRVKTFKQGEVTEVTATGNSAKINGIKIENGETILKTSEGEIPAEKLTFSENDAELVAYAEVMDENKANLFISQYDGKTSVNDYATSFELAYDYGVNKQDVDIALQNKGILTESQVSAIYKGAIVNQANAKQKIVDEINTKYAGNTFTSGTFDDSIIDYKKTGNGVDWDSLTSKQRSAIKFAKAFSQVTGVNITLSDKGMEQGFNGYYDADTNTITIDVYAGIDKLDSKTWEDSIVSTLSHEVTHWMKEKSPAMYEKMREHIIETMKMDGKVWSDLVNKQMANTLKNHPNMKEKITEEYAEDEIIARTCEDMLANSDTARKLINRMTESEQKTFMEQVKSTFNRLIDWVNDLLSQYQSKSKEAQILREYRQRLKELSKMWDKALAEAVQTNQSMKSSEINGTLETIGLHYDEESEIVYSFRSLEDQFNIDDAEDFLKTKEEYINALMKATKRSRKMCENYLNSLFLVYDLIGNDRARLDYEAAINKSAWVSNVEYGGSIDFSTLCAKRRLFTGTMDAIIEQLPNTVLTDMDFLDIRHRLLAKELESPCSMCYVEGSRAKNSIYINNWLTEYKKTNPEWMPQLADFTSTVRLEQTRLQHPEAYKAYQDAMNKLSQRKPKEASVRTDYKGEIKVAFSDGTSVDIKNKNGGIRFNSFSDFEIIHALDCMQVITDMATVGLAGQGYTKVKEFAECFGNTGMKINLSLVAKGVDKNGKLIFDEVNGMKYAEALDLRTRFSKNVGTVIVVFNNEQLKIALRDNTIDYVLPFHRSQWRKAQYTLMGLPTNTMDYTNHQNDRIRNPKTGRPVKLSKIKHISTYTNDITGETFKIKENIMPNQYWDYSQDGVVNANRYLDYINSNKMTPKFAFLLSKDADGNWVLPTDKNGNVTEEGKGFFKLLIDFKMYDNNGVGSPQTPVVPDFNMPYIREMLDSYNGGHESFPVAHDVADSFVEDYKKNHKKKQYSDRDSDGNQLTKEQVEFFKDSKVRDENGNLMVVYHGTENYGFTVFDPMKADDKTSLFFTNDYDMAQSYVNDDSKAYKVYLNLKNPLVIDAKGHNWNNIRLTHSDDEIMRKAEKYVDIAMRYDVEIDLSLLVESLGNLSASVDYMVEQMEEDGDDAILSKSEVAELRTLASELDEAYENWNEEEHLDDDGEPMDMGWYLANMRLSTYTTREISKKAKREGYDGVIINNVYDNGKHYIDRGIQGFGNVYIAFNSNQVKNVDNTNPTEDADIRYSDRVTDEETINFLNKQIENGEYITVYRSFQVIDGGLYAPMNAVDRDEQGKNKKLGYRSEYGQWEMATESPEIAQRYMDVHPDAKYAKFDLDGVDNKTNGVAYNPYLHASNLVLNDQFSAAYRRNLITVECRVPISEIGAYKAKYAKDTTGWVEWKPGGVAGKLAKIKPELTRKLFVSRYMLPVRKVEEHEVAQMYKEYLEGTDIAVPWNVVTPKLRKELEKIGVEISYDDIKAGSKTISFSDVFGDEARYSDRDNVSVYEAMGEEKRLIAENKKLSEDVDRLRERLKLEKQVTNGNTFNKKQLDAVAGHIRKLANSNYDKVQLVNELNEVYSYIVQTPNLIWDNLIAKCYEIAGNVLKEQRGVKVIDNYFKDVLTDIRKTRISLTQEQIQEAKKVFGEKYRNAFMGRIMITNDGINLDQKWQEWSSQYPEIFDSDITGGDQITALSDIYDYLRDGATSYQMFNDIDATRSLATEIYNQYWNVSTIRTTADKYDKQIKRLNFEHRKTMSELRAEYKDRLQKQKAADRAYYGEIIRNIRQRNETELRQAREFGRRRVNEYKDRMERNSKIKSITNKALTLNKWLTKNSKDSHIAEPMKKPVSYLLNAIDFSSKQLLGMNGGDKAFTETRKDISLSKALEQVHDMVQDISNSQVSEKDIESIYGGFVDFPPGFADDVKKLSNEANDIMRSVGDNSYVLNQMSLEELQKLDEIVSTIKSVVTQMNKFLAVRHAEGIAHLSNIDIEYLDSLGKGKVEGKLKKLLNWSNTTPYYAFKRFGQGGQKVYEALMDGWDKFSFHVKDIIDFTKSTYKSKEVKEWESEIKTFRILKPATDEILESHDYEPVYQSVQMSVPQIMSMYCLSKRKKGMDHLLGGGMRVSDIETKKGIKKDIITQPEGVVLSSESIEEIISSLTDRQRKVAEKLQEFMNTTCKDWGNEVSMLRFGYKSMEEDNYFPIQSDQNNLQTNDKTDNENSLFRLLNMSFTKSTDDKANNRIVVSGIFDVFAQHSSDMAKYNALALPVLDAFKWYNYKTKMKTGDTQHDTKTIKQSLEYAYGKNAQNYIITFLKDINGAQNTSRDTVGNFFFKNAKIASVAANLRVAFLQPTSYLRASAVIDVKYLSKALLHKPKISNAEKYCGIALWKSLGFYDTNIQRGVTSLIKHDETLKDKAIEKSMKGAEWGDKITWGYLWNACELEVRENQKELKVGSDEFYSAISKRLREVIYATQVVDSTMTRSQLMRSGDGYDKMLTAFASEPTLSYSMMQDASWQYKLAKRRGEGKSEMRKHKNHFVRVAMAYTITNVMCALVESGFDAYRDDDDDDEANFEEFIKLYLKNFLNDMSFTGKVPYIKEMSTILQGFSTSRTDTQWMQSFVYAGKGVLKLIQGKGNAYSTYKHIMRSFSYVSGLPFYNAWRDLVSGLNKFNILTAEELEEAFNELLEIE